MCSNCLKKGVGGGLSSKYTGKLLLHRLSHRSTALAHRSLPDKMCYSLDQVQVL